MSNNVDETWRVRSESVSLERLDGETILINFETGQYFSFRGSSADILWLVDAGVPRHVWGHVFEKKFPGFSYGDDVRNQIDDFLAALSRAGVIVRGSGAVLEAVELPDDYVREAWSPPVVEANDDLADLLVIDPIHDTGDDGWPNARPY